MIINNHVITYKELCKYINKTVSIEFYVDKNNKKEITKIFGMLKRIEIYRNCGGLLIINNNKIDLNSVITIKYSTEYEHFRNIVMEHYVDALRNCRIPSGALAHLNPAEYYAWCLWKKRNGKTIRE